MADIAWWMAPDATRDHLFAICPALVAECRGRPPIAGKGNVGDPYDSTVCGWCQRVYRARNRVCLCDFPDGVPHLATSHTGRADG